MSAVYANFFNPQTISILFCLHELQKLAEMNEVDIKSDLVKLLLNKILAISDADKNVETNDLFEAELITHTKNEVFLARYRSAIEKIDCFNKFYGEISNILKTLRSMRNSKLAQSNLVDFFVRRLYIYFEKLDFKEIVLIYQRFMDYKNGVPSQLKQHEFMLTKSIEEVKFNLENYSFNSNPEELTQVIDELAAEDHTFKTSYLKGIIYAQSGHPAQSSHFLRRYFDKNLSNLFQDRLVEGGGGNKINHCILSNAYSGLQLGHLDQCLQSISQGLRISQNNSDEQSINNCIIYLYNVAQKLGKFRQQILLAEHAITHSLNQSNLTLTLYSCLNCSLFQKRYNCGDSSLSLLKTREVSWKDALHFSKKKLHSHFQNNCRNIYHTHRNLLIPSFVHKLAILTHIPSLKKLFLNPFYQRDQLMELSIYKEFQNKNKLMSTLKASELYLKMGFSRLLFKYIEELEGYLENGTPLENIKIKTFINLVRFKHGSATNCFQNAQSLLEYSKDNGFTKQQYVCSLFMIAEVLNANQLLYDGLVKIEEALKICIEHNLCEERLYAQILKAEILLKIGHLAEPISTIQSIAENGDLTLLCGEKMRRFHIVKLLLNQKVSSLVQSQERQQIDKNIIECYKQIIRECIEGSELVQCEQWISKMLFFIEKHPTYMNKTNQLSKARNYALKSLNILSTIEMESIDDRKLSLKVMQKIRRILDL